MGQCLPHLRANNTELNSVEQLKFTEEHIKKQEVAGLD